MSEAKQEGTMFGHPKGLFLLFTTELWERFSYYAMRAILVLYLVDKVQSGTFSIAPATLTRNAVVAMHFELVGGATHIVDQEVQIRNVP